MGLAMIVVLSMFSKDLLLVHHEPSDEDNDVENALTTLTEQQRGSSTTVDYSQQFNHTVALMIVLTVGISGLFIIRCRTHSLVRQVLKQCQPIQTEAESVKEISLGVAKNSQHAADLAQHQHLHLDRTVQTLNQLIDMIRHNTASMDHLSTISQQAITAVHDGKQSANNMQASIEKIVTATTDMKPIIQHINTIAEQTNLLALNAAIKASRSGTMGEGFAVVADEIRALAQRSAEAAQSTQELIIQGLAHTHKGNELAKEISDQLQQVISQSQSVNDSVQSVSHTSAKQLQVVDGLNHALHSLQASTNANSERSQGCLTEAKTLAEGSRMLNDMIHTVRKEAGSAEAYAVIINLSGRQRMLTQKMSKEVCCVALEIDTNQYFTALQQTAELFDRTLHGLKHGDQSAGIHVVTSPEIHEQLDKVSHLWEPFFDRINHIIERQQATRQDLDFIAKHNIPLLHAMNNAVQLFDQIAAKAKGNRHQQLSNDINLAGRQRMLIQKMTKEYLLTALLMTSKQINNVYIKP